MRNLVVLTIFATTVFGIWDESRYHDKNDWLLWLSNFGEFAQDSSSEAGGIWPKDSSHKMIFGAGIWVGAIRPQGDTFVSEGYNPNRGHGECVPGALPNEPGYTDTTEHVYLSTEPHFPFLPRSHQDAWCVYNDFDTIYHLIDSIPRRKPRRPLGLTIGQRSSIWNSRRGNDIVFIEFTVRNDTNYTIRRAYVALAIDPDIGSAWDDIYGLCLPKKLGFCSDVNPAPNWGYVGVKLLSPLPLKSFKTFTLDRDPPNDTARYLMMAGYDYVTGQYRPFDSICPGPADQRFLMTVGPDSLLPHESLRVWFALIGASDLTESYTKADYAQWLFDNNFPHHRVTLTYPNGGEYLSNSIWIKWNIQSGTGFPLYADILTSPDLGRTWDTLFRNQPNQDSILWNTSNRPDGSGYLMKLIAHDSMVDDFDVSDSAFSIDNPGNGPPFVRVLNPSGESLSGTYKIRWFARDPEMRDSLSISIYLKGLVGGWQTLATNEPNDREYDWDSRRYQNGKSWIKITASDGSFMSADSCSCYVYNRISGGAVVRRTGINNLVSLFLSVHRPEMITGHVYLLAFEKPSYFYYQTILYPAYVYTLIDSNLADTLMARYSLADNGYQWDTTVGSFLIKDFGPLVDGFSVETRTQGPMRYWTFVFDSIEVLSGVYPETLLEPDAINNLFDARCAWRGSNYLVKWIRGMNGGISAEVWDEDYCRSVPFRRNLRYGTPDSSDAWCFWTPRGGGDPRDTLRLSYDTHMYICGSCFRFSRYGFPPTFPAVGDSWRVYSKPIRPPVDGNSYRFRPTVSIEELAALTRSLFLAPNRPNPFSRTTLISYAIPTKTRVKLVVYDVTGRKVKTICNRALPSGIHSFVWCGDDDRKRPLASGVYFLRMEALEKQFNRKIVLVR